MVQFQEKTWKDGRTEGQTLFNKTLPATPGDPITTTAVDWHLKVKDIEYNVGLPKTYCVTISMQKNQFNSALILKTQQILGSH